MYKYRLYPSKSQTKILEEQLELCHQTYNWLLHRCRSTYKETGKLLTQFDLNNALTSLKRQRPETRKVHSQVLQNISKRIKDAYTVFFARRRACLKAGLPRFKKPGRYRSITYPQSGFRVEGGRLSLSKIGEFRIRLHREIQGQVKTLTVKRMPSGRWYACFSCNVEAQPREKPHGDVGVDLGLHSYAVLSDGAHIENPRYYRASERRLAHLQRGLSRKEGGSRNWVKAKTRVARLHEKIQNRRSDFLHKASRRIAE
jgi:putative transposase